MITSPSSRIDKYEQSGLWEGLTLHDLLAVQAEKNPTVLAVVDPLNRMDLVGSESLRLTFSELNQASINFAAHLLNNGVNCGDKIVVQLPNIVELVVTYMAVSKIGAIISPIPIQYGTHEVAHITATLNANAYISLDQLKGESFAENLIPALADGMSVFTFGENLSVDVYRSDLANTAVETYRSLNPITANHISTICWTSGTTGTPKGVPRSHNMWVTVGRNCIEAGNYQAGDRLLNPFPLVNMASVGSFLYPFVLLGCTLVLHHPFDPVVFLQQIQVEEIAFTIVPPAMLNQLAKNETMWNQFNFDSLRSIGSGSAPLAPWMIEQFDNVYQKKIVNFYGSNEGINLFSRPEDIYDPEIRASMFPRFGSAGNNWSSSASKTIQTKIIDIETGDDITEAGVAGELVVKGPTIFDGYFGMDNVDVFTEDGFFLTGDLVEICGDEDQFYRIAGRSKDIINRGGMKLSPSEIDVLLEGLPGTVEAAVCAYPDDNLGERICACVVPSSSSDAPTLAQVVNYLQSKGIAKIKLPERLELFDALPRNPLGKVQRFMLQEKVSES